MRISDITGVFHNGVLWCALISWAVAQGLKVPIYAMVEKKLSFKRFWGSGGMPSSHTAMVVALAMMIGYEMGFNSVAFAISFVLASIVMYDAAGVRREAGTQAVVINQILRDVLIDGKPISDQALKELVGHTPLEVFAGFWVGIAVFAIYISF